MKNLNEAVDILDKEISELEARLNKCRRAKELISEIDIEPETVSAEAKQLKNIAPNKSEKSFAMMNTKYRRHNSNSVSQYKGVSPTRSGKWRAQNYENGKVRHIGTFATKIDAAAAYAKHTGNMAEYVRLSGLAEQTENNPDRQEKRHYKKRIKKTLDVPDEPDPKPELIPRWECIKCHKKYNTIAQPYQCTNTNCGSLIFDQL